MKTETDVAEILGLFAARSNRKMGRLELSLYLKELAFLSWPVAYAVLEKMFSSIRHMPTIDEIMEAGGERKAPSITDADLVNDAVSRIRQAVSKYGMPNWHQAEPFIGDLGCAIVKRLGGWTSVCEPETYQALDFLLKTAKDIGLGILKAQDLKIGERPFCADDRKLSGNAIDIVKRLAEKSDLQKKSGK